MSAVDLGQEISLSDLYFLLLQATIKGSKVLRAQVAERTEKEEDVNRLTVIKAVDELCEKFSTEEASRKKKRSASS